jgi:hypothetical protein
MSISYPLGIKAREFEKNHGQIQDFIGVFPDLYEAKFCDLLISKFETIYNSGFGHKHHWGINRKDSAVFSSDIVDVTAMGVEFKSFLDKFWEIAYAEYKREYDILDTAQPHGIFSCKIQRSKIGEGFHQWHFDTLSRDTTNRLIVFILYLNDVEEGGETEFLYIPKRVKPRTGTLLMFPAGMTHTHRGNPPISNSKYILTGWIEY